MPARPRHALAETAASYGTDARTHSVKLSISLPADLVDQIRTAAAQSGVGVSGVIAAAVRHSLATAEQERIDRALALDAEDDEAYGRVGEALAADLWADLTW